MINKIKAIWQIIKTGQKYNSEIDESQEHIQEWLNVYRGKSSWLKYSYVTLDGYKKERCRKTLSIAKMICAELSGLIWSEEPEIITDINIENILEDSSYMRIMPDFTERLLALGGGVLKLYVSDNQIKIDYVPADRFIPISWNNNNIYEADFIDQRVIDGKEYIRIESHRKAEGGYYITNKAYQLINGQKIEVSLIEMGEKYEPEVFVKVENPLFRYIKVVGDNNLIDNSPLGISIFANAMDTIEALDIAFDSLNQEILLGKKRIIVPTSAIRKVVNTDTGKMERYFDPSDEVFVSLSASDNERFEIKDNSVELRISEIRMAIQTLLDIFSIQIGMSAGFLSFDGSSMKTATEVISENSKTFKTKQSIENQIKYGTSKLMESMRELCRLYNIGVSNNEYNMIFNDSIIEDRNSKTKYYTDRLIAGTITLSDYLMEVDGLSQVEADAKAEKIRSENATIDVNSMFGGIDQ